MTEKSGKLLTWLLHGFFLLLLFLWKNMITFLKIRRFEITTQLWVVLQDKITLTPPTGVITWDQKHSTDVVVMLHVMLKRSYHFPDSDQFRAFSMRAVRELSGSRAELWAGFREEKTVGVSVSTQLPLSWLWWGVSAEGWEVGGQRVSLIPKGKPLILCKSVPVDC